MDAALKETFGALVATPPSVQLRTSAADPLEKGISVPIKLHNATQARSYSKEEWEARKPMIEQHYAAGTLETTRAALRDDGFSVTKKQLKSRVMDWGFRKNFKKEERLALVQQHTHAKALGGERSLPLQNPLNVVITPARMERMVRRDGRSGDLVSGPPPTLPPDTKHHPVNENLARNFTIRTRRHVPSNAVIEENELQLKGELFDHNTVADPAEESMGNAGLPAEDPLVRLGLALEELQGESEIHSGDGLLSDGSHSSGDGSIPDDGCLHVSGTILSDHTHPVDGLLSIDEVNFGSSDDDPGFEHEILSPVIPRPSDEFVSDRNPPFCTQNSETSSHSQTTVASILSSDDDWVPSPEAFYINGPCSGALQSAANPTVVDLSDDMEVDSESSTLPIISSDSTQSDKPHAVVSETCQNAVGRVGNKRSRPSKDAFIHAENLARIRKALSDVLADIGFGVDVETDAKPHSKRKQRDVWVFPAASMPPSDGHMSDDTKRLKLRAGPKDWEKMYAFGFRPVKQLDDSISMILPPLFDKPYLREKENKRRSRICQMDRLYGSDDVRTISALGRLANTVSKQSRPELAEVLYHRIGTKFGTLLGYGHMDTLAAFEGLATMLRNQDRYSEATKLLEQLESCSQDMFGADSAFVLNIRRQKYTVLNRMGKHIEIELQLRDLHNRISSTYGRLNHDSLRVARELASSLRKQGKTSESRDILRDVLSDAKKTKKVWSAMLILSTKRTLGHILIREGSKLEGRRLVREVEKELEILRPGIDPQAPLTL